MWWFDWNIEKKKIYLNFFLLIVNMEFLGKEFIVSNTKYSEGYYGVRDVFFGNGEVYPYVSSELLTWIGSLWIVSRKCELFPISLAPSSTLRSAFFGIFNILVRNIFGSISSGTQELNLLEKYNVRIFHLLRSEYFGILTTWGVECIFFLNREGYPHFFRTSY